MKINLAIAGRGAVTPAGVGVDALLQGKTSPAMIEELGRPGQRWPVLRVDLKDPAFARWQCAPRLRRASAVTFFLVEAAAQALVAATAEERAQTGLIVAFSAGCLVYSRRFFDQIVAQGQRAASPALFPETVFNSPVSHVAAVLGLNGAAYALVGDEGAWASAIITASIWLEEGRVQQVLVLGAEEFDALELDAYRSARWLRRHESGGFIASEGAAGLLVRPAAESDLPTITTARDGFIYRTKKEAARAAAELLSATDSAIPVVRTAQRNCMRTLEANALKDRPAAPPAAYLGEAFTASAAWRTLQAATLLGPERPRLLLPLWGLNHQFALLELAAKK
jgi:3-oxoacyl-(acyl-carrier-protein) synthase